MWFRKVIIEEYDKVLVVVLYLKVKSWYLGDFSKEIYNIYILRI